MGCKNVRCATTTTGDLHLPLGIRWSTSDARTKGRQQEHGRETGRQRKATSTQGCQCQGAKGAKDDRKRHGQVDSQS